MAFSRMNGWVTVSKICDKISCPRKMNKRWIESCHWKKVGHILRQEIIRRCRDVHLWTQVVRMALTDPYDSTAAIQRLIFKGDSGGRESRAMLESAPNQDSKCTIPICYHLEPSPNYTNTQKYKCLDINVYTFSVCVYIENFINICLCAYIFVRQHTYILLKNVPSSPIKMPTWKSSPIIIFSVSFLTPFLSSIITFWFLLIDLTFYCILHMTNTLNESQSFLHPFLLFVVPLRSESNQVRKIKKKILLMP